MTTLSSSSPRAVRLATVLGLSLCLAGSMLAGSALAASQPVSLAAPAEGDLVATTPIRVDGPPALGNVPREPVQFTFPLEKDVVLESPRPFVDESREYFVEVSTGELRRGAVLLLTAPGAVVRLNPAPGSASMLTLDLEQMVLVGADGVRFAAGSGMETLASAEAMSAADAPFAEGTVAFRTAGAVGVGPVTLSAPDLKAEGTVHIHVFEPASDVVLSLRTGAVDVLHGDALEVVMALEAGDRLAAVDGVEAFVTSPAGRAWPVRLRRGVDGLYRGSLTIDADEAPAPGLWEVHAAARADLGGLTAARSARTALGAHLPTAALQGGVVVEQKNGLAIEFGVEVGTPGRFEVRGMLFGTARDGSMQPIAAGHAADHLRDDGTLTLVFDADTIKSSRLVAPYELRALQLTDQGRMSVLHRQAVGLQID